MRVHVFESLSAALLGVERRQQGSPERTALWMDPGEAPGRQQQNLLPRGEAQPLGDTPERADHERFHDTTPFQLAQYEASAVSRVCRGGLGRAGGLDPCDGAFCFVQKWCWPYHIRLGHGGPDRPPQPQPVFLAQRPGEFDACARSKDPLVDGTANHVRESVHERSDELLEDSSQPQRLHHATAARGFRRRFAERCVASPPRGDDERTKAERTAIQGFPGGAHRLGDHAIELFRRGIVSQEVHRPVSNDVFRSSDRGDAPFGVAIESRPDMCGQERLTTGIAQMAQAQSEIFPETSMQERGAMGCVTEPWLELPQRGRHSGLGLIAAHDLDQLCLRYRPAGSAQDAHGIRVDVTGQRRDGALRRHLQDDIRPIVQPMKGLTPSGGRDTGVVVRRHPHADVPGQPG
ncbi:hypothetical protein [Sorangium atrum]|uniref:Uncharacterized protein n=1 Tax=Sorangium atrum TaxID=2995308 RepID=A0ABT5C7Z8_9BACT|nr:hypothetical protein [Sorangium aterium]MDC0681291.1 hypothetical protein [Sorangium aterium]